MTTDSVAPVDDDNFRAAVLEASGPVLVDFWAPWCTNCSRLESAVHEAARDNPGLRVVTVDVDSNPQIQAECRVMSLPTLMLYVDGAIVVRKSGFDNARAMLNELDAHLDAVRP